MSKVNQIQMILRSIDGGRFQKLCDAYLRQSPRYANLKSIGSVLGKDKTKTGVPDSLITLPDGTFALAHYTTQESNLPGKLRGDFDSSFDEADTGLPVDQVKEVVLCYNGTLDTKDELSLLSGGRERGVTVIFRDLEKIAYDLFDKYPGLAKEFLNVEVDSGQIVTQQEFVNRYGRSSFSTRLDTAFHFREEELKRVLAALDTTDLILITGGAGVGKSRLMLEVAHRYSANEEWIVRCVFNRGVDLSQDLKVYFKRPGKYLILVDDANRLSGFEYILHLLHDQTSEVHVKIIATVRDYARERILEQTKPFGGGYEESLKPFTDEQIRMLVSDEGGIKDYYYLTRIESIARGNPRLAMMAAKLAVEHQTLHSIADVTALYDEYFGSVRTSLEGTGDERVVKVAGIVALFRVVDRSNHEIMDAIAEALDIPPSVFWHTVEHLDRLEFLDLYEHEVAKFADQVLATYLFYFAVFRSGALDFSILLDRFFPRYRSLFIDALDPVINSLGARVEDQLRPHIDRKWKVLQEEGREKDLIALIQVFWFVRQTETLLYIRQETAKLSYEEVSINTLNFRSDSGVETSPLLDLLGAFYGGDHFSTALELVLEFFAKRPRSVGNVLRILKNDFGFRPESALLKFSPQREVMDRLWMRADHGHHLLFAKLFLGIAAHYLRTQFEVTKYKKMSVSWIRFDLPPTPDVHDLRQSIWQHVFDLYGVPELQGDVLSTLHDYPHSGYQVSGHEILSKDSEAVIPFLRTTLDPADFKHASQVHHYLDLLDREGVTYDLTVRERFTTRLTRLAALLNLQRYWRDSIEDAEKRQEEELRSYVSGFTVDDYEAMLNECSEIARANRTSDAWALQRGIEAVFTVLEDEGPDVYIPVVTSYLEMGTSLGVSGYQVATALIKFTDVAAAHDLIRGKEYPDKRRWLFAFFGSIPPDRVDHSHLEGLYDLYRTASPYDLPNNFRLLDRYTTLDDRAVVRVVEILLSRTEAEKEPGFARHLGSLFNHYVVSSEKLLSYFGSENVGLLKKAYLAARRAHDTSDYDGRVFSLILDCDRSFIREYINLLVVIATEQKRKWLNRLDDSRNFGFLWRREDYELVMRDTIQFLFELQQTGEVYVSSLLEVLFGTDRSEKVDAGIMERQVGLLAKLVEESADEQPEFTHFIFGVAGGFPDEKRRDLIAIFLSRNKRVEDFERLSLDRRSGAIVGSPVPRDQMRLEFIESLLPLVEGLDFLDHRYYLEKWIEAFRRIIETEKRHDFMREI